MHFIFMVVMSGYCDLNSATDRLAGIKCGIEIGDGDRNGRDASAQPLEQVKSIELGQGPFTVKNRHILCRLNRFGHNVFLPAKRGEGEQDERSEMSGENFDATDLPESPSM